MAGRRSRRTAMRWICPQCRRPVSLAFTECPFCRAVAAEPPPSRGQPDVFPQLPLTTPKDSQVTAEMRAVTPPGQPLSALSVRVSTPARAQPVIPEPTPAIESQTHPAAAESSESPLYRGFRLGLGFALALAFVFLLLVVLLTWLTGKSWLDWLRH